MNPWNQRRGALLILERVHLTAASSAVGIAIGRRLHADLARSQQAQAPARSRSKRKPAIGKIPRDDRALCVDASADQIELSGTFGLPGMLVISHPLDAHRFADRARQQSGIFGDIIGAHAAIAAGGFAQRTRTFFSGNRASQRLPCAFRKNLGCRCRSSLFLADVGDGARRTHHAVQLKRPAISGFISFRSLALAPLPDCLC